MTTAAPLHPTPAHQPQHHLSSNLDHSTNDKGFPALRGPVTSELQFYDPPADGSAPYQYAGDLFDNPPPGEPQRNFGQAAHKVEIQDIRGREHLFTLDHNAFEALSNVPSGEENFRDDSIKRVYYPEVERLLLENVPGANRIVLFDYTIRRADPHSARNPVTRVHIDQTPASAEARVRHHLPEEADELLRSRYRIINVWRPLNGPVLSFPLAIADSATVEDRDLVGVQHRYPDRNGETAGVKYNPSQQWYYWSGMQNNERLLLKCFDSDENLGKWGRVPHTAFVDPRTPEGAPGRESIEVRALVFG